MLTSLFGQAEAELSDEKKRETIDAVLKAARNATLKSMSLPQTVLDTDPRLKPTLSKFKQDVKAKVKEMLIEEEVRRRTCVALLFVPQEFVIDTFHAGRSRST